MVVWDGCARRLPVMRGLGRNLTIQGAVTFEYEHEVRSYMELFTDRSSFRRLFLACSIQASVQMTWGERNPILLGYDIWPNGDCWEQYPHIPGH
jgi:hypothetical protein